jgi:hypothetical protein
MKNDADLSVWQGQLEVAAVALAECPDTPDWLKQVVLDALAVAAEITPGIEHEQAQDNLFFYPH